MSIIKFSSIMILIIGCTNSNVDSITSLEQLKEGKFAVPTGSTADKLVLSKFPNAKFQYYNSILDAAIAVKQKKVDAAAYDEPILKNIAGKNAGLTVLPEMITHDSYGFAVRADNDGLKKNIDSLLAELKSSGEYEDMIKRWLPADGHPQPMPFINEGTNGVIRLGTAAITEPFSFVDSSHQVVGIDIEIASRLAKQLNKKLEIVDMEFGAMIPALVAGKVDMIGACITITEERKKKVLFSKPYYMGGIAAIVRTP